MVTANTITCDYSLTVVGNRSVASLEAAMAAVPVDLTLPHLYGLLYVGDTTSAASQVLTRSMVFRFTPTSVATAHTTLVPGDGSGSPVNAVIVDGGGLNYAAPPLPQFLPADARQPDRKARGKSIMGAGGVTVIAGGTGYTDAAVTFSHGDLVPGGTQATGTVTFSGGGAVTGITITNPGGPYNVPPLVSITSMSGSGAVVTVGLAVTSIKVIDPGLGYQIAPTINFVPYFETFFPNGVSNQASSLQRFMLDRFTLELASPLLAADPVLGV